MKMIRLTIGIKHDFPLINIRKVPREVLKTEGEDRGFQPSRGTQVSVYRTIGPLLISICPEDRNVFARFDEISSMTLDINETVFTKAIKNYKGK